MGSLLKIYDDFEWTPPSVLAELAHNKRPWLYYLATAVRFDSGTVRPADDGDGENPPLGPLHVITAVHPNSHPDSAENAVRMAVLDSELVRRGVEALPAVGVSFDDNHREDSRAIFGFTDNEARALGRRFGQVAIFGWRGRQWSVLACATDRIERRAWRWEVNEGYCAEGFVRPSG